VIETNSKKHLTIDVVIPAYNEEQSIGKVISDLPKELVREIVVVSNNSTDNTEEVAAKAGATVLVEKRKGYGAACLKGIEYLKNKEDRADIVLFIDGDYSDFPAEAINIVQPILDGKAEMVIGSRALGKKEKGSMTIPQRFGNWLSTRLIKLIYKVKFTDLGPFRAITFDKLIEIDMKDQTFGWTCEMQVKAAKLKVKSVEVPVNYRKRIGVSKVSGTIKGAFMAGYKILWTIFKNL
jgi:glycosyltransferase involved in cell wall biosynthesis